MHNGYEHEQRELPCNKIQKRDAGKAKRKKNAENKRNSI